MAKILMAFFMLFISGFIIADTAQIYAFNDLQKEKQFNGLLKELRCLVCQNQDLADSNAKLAVELKNLVYDKVNLNQSNTTIKTFLIERYGDFVTFAPPLSEKTYILWLMPMMLLALGLIFAIQLIKKASQ